VRLEGQVGLIGGTFDDVLVEVQLDPGLAARGGQGVVDLDLERVLRVCDHGGHDQGGGGGGGGGSGGAEHVGTITPPAFSHRRLCFDRAGRRPVTCAAHRGGLLKGGARVLCLR